MNTTIIDTPPKFQTERKESSEQPSNSLTILFADSTSPNTPQSQDDIGAEQGRIARYCELAGEAVKKHGGQIIKAIGGSVIAEFSNPAEAVHAAVTMERMSVAQTTGTSQGDQPAPRIGIYSLAGQRPGIEVFGDVMKVAASFAKLAAGAQILISREAYQAISNEKNLNCRWVRSIAIEGQKEHDEVFEVSWVEAPSGIASRYKVLSQIGTGGMGIVFKVRDEETNEIVALKILKTEIAGDPAMQENLRREVCLARKVTHKNVCRIHEFNRSNGGASISMEFVEGESLLSRIRREGALPWSQAMSGAMQICAGLREAHAQGIVHRDLKPANIMIDRNGGIKIMDFGIAREFQGTGQMTGTLIGTPAYMAPEQVEMKPADARTDIYALGLLMYEMVTGLAAFEGDTPIGVALKQIRELPKRPREIVSTLPAQAEKIILKCLQKDPTKRFQSVDELSLALRRESGLQPAVSQWDRFISDFHGVGCDLQRGFESGLELAGNFLRRQNWSALRNPRAKKALAVGLGVVTAIGGVIVYSANASRRGSAGHVESNAASPVVAGQNSKAPALAAKGTNDSAEKWIVPSTSIRQISSFNVNLGPANSSVTNSSPSVEKSSKATQSTSKVASEKHNEKSQAPVHVSHSPANARHVAAASSTTPVNQAPQDATISHTPPATVAVASAQPGAETAKDLFPSANVAIPAELANEEKAADVGPAGTASSSGRFLEVGTFKDTTWADEAVAKLNQLGYHASSVHKGRLWMQAYQVRVGPYADAKELESAQKSLTSQGFKPHPVK